MTISTPTGPAIPFRVAPQLLPLKRPYPSLDEILGLGHPKARLAREAFTRLWLTEGIPFAFQQCPAVYEEVRGWLAALLGTNPKEVTLVGSARLGYSLAGPSKLGRPFGKHSDLDFSVVSSGLFTQFQELFTTWARDYENLLVKPRSDFERRLWDANLDFGRQNLPKGFFDANKIPTFNRYPLAQEVGQVLWAVMKKLEQTPAAPVARRASVRVYDGWQSLIDRASFNLYWALAH